MFGAGRSSPDPLPTTQSKRTTLWVDGRGSGLAPRKTNLEDALDIRKQGYLIFVNAKDLSGQAIK